MVEVWKNNAWTYRSRKNILSFYERRELKVHRENWEVVMEMTSKEREAVSESPGAKEIPVSFHILSLSPNTVVLKIFV